MPEQEAQAAAITLSAIFGTPTQTDRLLEQIAWPVKYDPNTTTSRTFSQDIGEVAYHTDTQYFEAVTVFSEYTTARLAKNDADFGSELVDTYDGDMHLDGSALAKWVAADREYEFKLRAARYAADVLMVKGADYPEVVESLCATFGITEQDAEKEIRKYLPWTGLGAVYTYGYRTLEAAGVRLAIDAMQDENGTAITTWVDFNNSPSHSTGK